MPAGTVLHRGLQNGMKESCAAVFFITSDFKDEKYLRAEIDHALEEKTQRGEAFSIITLQIAGPSSEVGTVPEPLKRFLYKTVKTPLQGFREIIQALPAPFREIRPVPEPTAEPKVRVTASAGHLVSTGPHPESEAVVLVRIENHGSETFYLTGSVCFDRDDTNMHSLIKRDANGHWPTPRALAPGDGFTIPVSMSILVDYAPHVTRFFFTDQVGRIFATGEGEAHAAFVAVLEDES
jgi:hypothetical protein